MLEPLAIAIDFGTTYSGIAYARVHGMRMLFTQLGNWPGQPPTRNSYKVPTIVAYPDNGDPPLWGFEAERSTRSLRMRVFKTFLDPRSADKYQSPPGKTLNDIVHDYLEGLYSHLTKTLIIEGLSSNDVDYKFLLTVPATFENGAVENFRRIVKTTGIGNHDFEVSLTEPEAAALYTMEAQPMRTNKSYRVGDCFVVCDAGGGTVDLSSYTILQIHPKVLVEQTGITSGAYCGSTSIDLNFKSFMSSVLGPETMRGLTTKEKDAMLEGFVEQKERFDLSTPEENFNIRLPRDSIPCPGKKSGYFPISRDKMQELFADPVFKTQELIGSHVEECKAKGRRVSFLFLVGGFGTSPYLKSQIESYIHGIDPSILVVKPTEAQQAVVLGAILNQIQRLKNEDDPVRARLCRSHYGLLTMQVFDPNKHLEHEKYIHPDTKETFARNQISWFIRKGDRFTEGAAACIEKHLIRKFKRCDEAWSEVLVQFAGDAPPQRMGPGITEVCRLTADLRNCPKREFELKKMKREGWFKFGSKKYFQATYQVKIYIGTADVKFEMVYKNVTRSDLLALSWDKLDNEIVM